MYQTDGIYVVGTNTITWATPYLSNLKVGSLDAISANLGVVSIASAGNLHSGKTSSSDTTAGFFLGNDSGTPKFAVGDSTYGFSWNGSVLTVAGSIIQTGNIQANQVTSGDQGNSGAVSCYPAAGDTDTGTQTSGTIISVTTSGAPMFLYATCNIFITSHSVFIHGYHIAIGINNGSTPLTGTEMYMPVSLGDGLADQSSWITVPLLIRLPSTSGTYNINAWYSIQPRSSVALTNIAFGGSSTVYMNTYVASLETKR